MGSSVRAGRLSVCPPESALGGQSVRDRDMCGQFGFCRGNETPLAQLGQKLGRGRRQKTAGNFHAGYLGNDFVGADDLTVRTAVDPFDAVENHRQGQIEVGGGADAAHAVFQIKFDDAQLQIRVLGTVDQIEAEGAVGEGFPGLVDGGLDLGGGEPGGAEEPDHAVFTGRLDHRNRGDAVGHGPHDVSVTQAECFFETGVAQGVGHQGGGR